MLKVNIQILKLTTEKTFMFTSDFHKQTDGYTIFGPLSVIFSDTFSDIQKPHGWYCQRNK